jgi:hypothetical protein
MAIEWTQSEAGDAELLAICPFVHSILGAGNKRPSRRIEAGAQERPRPFPVMIRLREMLPAEFASGHAFFGDPKAQARWRRRVKVPAIYTDGNMRGRTRIVCTAWVTRWFFEQLASNAGLRGAVIRVTPDVPPGSRAMPPFDKDDEAQR